MPLDSYRSLLARLGELGGVLVAYSGGVDSTLLAFAAREALGDRAVAVLASSPTYPADEYAQAHALAARLGLELLEIATTELDDDTFSANPPDRCYHCKLELFGRIREIADAHGLSWVADGTNVDDLSDFRPGMRASAELGVLHPLADAGFTKDHIRTTAREIGLPNWDKPSLACLASRFPYGEPITLEGLERVAVAERAVREIAGISQLRVRAHGQMARVEVAHEELEAAWSHRAAIDAALKGAGFAWVAIDLSGYRTGSLNALLPDSLHKDT